MTGMASQPSGSTVITQLLPTHTERYGWDFVLGALCFRFFFCFRFALLICWLILILQTGLS